MSTPLIRYHAAMSLDGFIADREGGVHWLEGHPEPTIDFGAFMERHPTLVMGRSTYDQCLGFGWPYGGRRVVVLTSKPLAPDAPEGVAAWSGPVPELARRLRAETVGGDIWIVGGGKVAQAFLEAGEIDRLDVAIIPEVLGGGIPLLSGGTRGCRLELLEQGRYPSGIARLEYAVARP
ncbi:MAG TPA: dihydrofolate reductase family protein [Azospirillaceae bacterium]|nr:dihydrofolate reductase family protein [Azospirillaceae bacterium]